METSFSNSIAKLEQIESVRLDQEITENIRDINRFFSEDDIKAYLLGQLLWKKSETDMFEAPEMKRFLADLEERGLVDYFKGYKKAKLKNEGLLNWVILGFGLLVTILGVFRLVNSFIQVGISDRYGVMTVKEGGYPLLLGIGLIIVFFVRNKYRIRQKDLFDTLDT